MQVRLLGMEWEIGGGVSAQQFFHHLTSLNGKGVTLGYYERLLYSGERDGYFVGLFVTQKDQRKTCEVEKSSNQQFRITVRSLAKNTKLADFNFFVVNTKTLRGLYQYYHNSCSIPQFGTFCQREYDALSSKLCSREIRNGENERAAQRKYDGSMSCSVLVRPEKLGSLLSELSRISTFEFSYKTFAVNEPIFSQVADDVTTESHVMRFSKDGLVSKLRQAIVALVNDYGIGRGKVTGKDFDGLERTVRLLNTPDSFGERTHEHVTDQKNFTLDDIRESPFIDDMLSIAHQFKSHFE
jgi:hypothetical protein